MRFQPPGAGAMREGLRCTSCGRAIAGTRHSRRGVACADCWQPWAAAQFAASRKHRGSQAMGSARHEPRDMVSPAS